MTLSAAVRLGRLAFLPFTSFGAVTNSCRNPTLRVRLARTRKSSWTNHPKTVCRHPRMGLLSPPISGNCNCDGLPCRKVRSDGNAYTPRCCGNGVQR